MFNVNPITQPTNETQEVKKIKLECRTCRYYEPKDATCRVNPPDRKGFAKTTPYEWCSFHPDFDFNDV